VVRTLLAGRRRPRPRVVHTSLLTRAIRTADLALTRRAALAPRARHGASTSATTARLQGLNKKETTAKHGEAQVKECAAATPRATAGRPGRHARPGGRPALPRRARRLATADRSAWPTSWPAPSRTGPTHRARSPGRGRAAAPCWSWPTATACGRCASTSRDRRRRHRRPRDPDRHPYRYVFDDELASCPTGSW